jgi:hypothetical protein
MGAAVPTLSDGADGEASDRSKSKSKSSMG